MFSLEKPRVGRDVIPVLERKRVTSQRSTRFAFGCPASKTEKAKADFS